MPIDQRPPYVIEQGQSLSEVAHDRMLAMIDDGSWSPRSRLPSETELARSFGMSRPVIRQALAKLRDAGLIQSRQGSGSFVIGPAVNSEEPPENVLFPPIGSIADIKAFVTFREGLEGEIAATAASNRNADHLTEIAAAMAQFREVKPLSERSEDDFAFHLSIAKATGNPFFVVSLRSLEDQMTLGMGLIWKFSADRREFRDVVLAQHQSIYDAIALQDSEAARHAMKSHLRWAGARMLVGKDSSAKV